MLKFYGYKQPFALYDQRDNVFDLKIMSEDEMITANQSLETRNKGVPDGAKLEWGLISIGLRGEDQDGYSEIGRIENDVMDIKIMGKPPEDGSDDEDLYIPEE